MGCMELAAKFWVKPVQAGVRRSLKEEGILRMEASRDYFPWRLKLSVGDPVVLQPISCRTLGPVDVTQDSQRLCVEGKKLLSGWSCSSFARVTA